MVDFGLYSGDKESKSSGNKIKRTYYNNAMSQIKNSLGTYFGKKLKIIDGEGKVVEKGNRLFIIDDEKEVNVEAERARRRQKLLSNPHIEIIEEKGDVIRWRWKS